MTLREHVVVQDLVLARPLLSPLTVHMGSTPANTFPIHALHVLPLANPAHAVRSRVPFHERIVTATAERKGTELAPVAQQVIFKPTACRFRHKVLQQQILGQPLQTLIFYRFPRVFVFKMR